MSVSTDETLVIASDFYGTTRLLRFDDGTQIGAPLANGSMTAAERGTEPVVRGNCSVFLPGSHVALIVDWDTGAVRLVDVDSRTEASPPFTAFPGLSFWDVSPDGRVAAVGGANGATRLYDLQTGAQIGDPFPSTFSRHLRALHPRRPVHDHVRRSADHLGHRPRIVAGEGLHRRRAEPDESRVAAVHATRRAVPRHLP